jgi:hypothetical protein
MRIQSFVGTVFAIAIFSLAACGGDDDGDSKLCESYCTSIMDNCTAANQQFSSMAQCMTSCATYPVGDPADTSGNTLGCRTYHAGTPAMTAPDMHCRHAGPGGNGACGDDCAGFCTLVLGSCTGDNAQYGGDMSTCMTACAGFSKTATYSSSQTMGDTFACRLYHATVASERADHCPHTAAVSSACN